MNDFQRYLRAKRTVDDRALNKDVWQTFTGRLAAMPAPVRLLELGAGIGTMFERLAAAGQLARVQYTMLDSDPANSAAARARLAGQTAAAGLDFVTADALRYARVAAGGRCDVLLAHAFLDLLDLDTALPVLLRLLRPGGLFCFTINFDGVTAFEPVLEPALDEQVMALYHRTMDERLVLGRPSGDSRAGRHLFSHLRAAGATILAAGSSDWVVFAGPDGYPADEAFFLRFILDTVVGALEGHPDLAPADLARWAAARRAQLGARELVYVAHQLDFVGVV